MGVLSELLIWYIGNSQQIKMPLVTVVITCSSQLLRQDSPVGVSPVVMGTAYIFLDRLSNE